MEVYVVRIGFMYFQYHIENSDSIAFTPNVQEACWMSKSEAKRILEEIGGDIYTLEISLAKYDKADN